MDGEFSFPEFLGKMEWEYLILPWNIFSEENQSNFQQNSMLTFTCHSSQILDSRLPEQSITRTNGISTTPGSSMPGQLDSMNRTGIWYDNLTKLEYN